jgi:Ras-related protein Rab-2A
MFKVIIIGDTGVGKSCMISQLVNGTCKDEHNVTIGVEFGNYSMLIKDKHRIKLQIWDTAG